MKFIVVYELEVVKIDIPKLSKRDKLFISRAIETKLMERPEFFGKPLRNSLKGYRSLRVGDYRIVYRIEADFVKIFVIHHRSVVYLNSPARIISIKSLL